MKQNVTAANQTKSVKHVLQKAEDVSITVKISERDARDTEESKPNSKSSYICAVLCYFVLLLFLGLLLLLLDFLSNLRHLVLPLLFLFIIVLVLVLLSQVLLRLLLILVLLLIVLLVLTLLLLLSLYILLFNALALLLVLCFHLLELLHLLILHILLLIVSAVFLTRVLGVFYVIATLFWNYLENLCTQIRCTRIIIPIHLSLLTCYVSFGILVSLSTNGSP